MEKHSTKNIRSRRRKKQTGKTVALCLAVLLAVGGIVGGTLAWLKDQTLEVENTFTVGNIDIDLNETKDDFKMIPGWIIEKDPVVTVKAGSEDCWVFVVVEESQNLNTYITYEIDPYNWTKLDGHDSVYYIKVTDIADASADRMINVLLNNQVQVKEDVTKQMMDGLTVDGAEQPTLTFTAYAVQLYKSNSVEFEPAEAWEKVQPTP